MHTYRPVARRADCYDRRPTPAGKTASCASPSTPACAGGTRSVDLRRGDGGRPPCCLQTASSWRSRSPGRPVWLARLLSENGIRSRSFSKYGTYYNRIILGGQSALPHKKEVLCCA
jgi:hypothetical protein